MSEQSAIQWTDATWNVVTGCTKVSPACAHCYIERTPPFRMQGRKFVKGDIPIQVHMDRLDRPKHWTKPRRVFVNSLSDLFHADVPYPIISFVWRTMQETPRHVYQILTKRAERMAEVVPKLARHFGVLPNVWLGVSVENQRFMHERGEWLRRTPAAIRFISAEPLLGPLDIGFERPLLNWVIAGGESGPNHRASDAEWFRSLRDQCVAARVPFFFKQWGGKTPKSGGRLLDGREWNEFPIASPQEQETDPS